MAIPLVYDSCLFYDALIAAVEDFQVISRELEEQAKVKAEWEESYNSRRQAATENNEPFEEEEKTWEEIKFAPYKTQKREFVVCLDTMGQDRQFSDD